MSNILMVVTAADSLTLADGTSHSTGFWAEEAVVPYEELTKAGHEVVVATPGGVVPPVDEGSLAPAAAGGEDNAARMRAVVRPSATPTSGRRSHSCDDCCAELRATDAASATLRRTPRRSPQLRYRGADSPMGSTRRATA